MKNMLVILFIVLLTIACTQTEQVTSPRIGIYSANPFYFTLDGEPVLLLGGTDEDNLFNDPDAMMDNFNVYEEIVGNYIRCTMSSRDSGNVWPFGKNEENLYDLDELNPEYWNRFETCLIEAAERDIVVQVEMWATFDFYRDNWLVNPFNPKNNVNYTAENTSLPTEWPHHPAREPQPFFYSVPLQNNDTKVLEYQRAFVDALLNISLKYDNVLYCIDNETRAPAEWAWYWGEYINMTAEKAGKTVYVTEMWDPWDLHNEEHARTYAHPDIFNFVEMSQNNWQEGQQHYQNALWLRNQIKERGGARPMTNVKVYHRRGGGKPNAPWIGRDRWWQNIWAGCAGTRFHRPTGGPGLNEKSQQTLKAARVFTDEFDIFATEPRPDMLFECQKNEAYCLAQDDSIHAIYFPRGGNIRLRVDDQEAQRTVRWFDIETADFLPEKTMSGRHLSLTSPDTSKTWLVLVEK